MRTLALVLVILGVPTTSLAVQHSSLAPDSAGGLVLDISTPKLTYLIGEPIKIDAVLTNESSRTIWIRDIGCSIPFDFQVTCPTGVTESADACGVVISHCGTVPLPPGSGTYETVFPTTASGTIRGTGPCPFAIPGEHRVRLFYRSQPDWNRYVGDAEVVSNELILRFVGPDSVEGEILGALSHTEKLRLLTTWWCLEFYQNEDEVHLRSVIALYPEHPATNYARLQLVKYIGLERAPEEALRILLDLMNRDPEFWFEEVRIMIAKQMRYVGREADGRPYLLEAFHRRPLLITNPAFAWEYLVSLGGHDPDWKVPIKTYRERRERGELRIEDYFPVDSLRSHE